MQDKNRTNSVGNTKKLKKEHWSTFNLIIIFGILFLLPVFGIKILINMYDGFQVKKLIHKFQDSKQLLCKLNYGGENLLISQKRGWGVHKEYFIKGDKLIHASKCEKEE
jgi:hypothetical protein